MRPGILTAGLAACLGLFAALPAKAASLQLVPNWGASGVPTNLSMYIYVPDSVATNPPILVLLHYWGGGAAGVFAEAQGGGIVAAADQYGFIMVVPQRSSDCWDVNSTATLTHDGGGETQGVAEMVRYALTNYHANADRVYVTGTSCGAMMTEAMLAVYPDVFKAGAAFAGQVVGGAWTPITRTAQQWGDIVRNAYPGYSGPRPRVQLWHGTADTIINYSNQVEAIMQWGNVLGLNTNPTSTATLTILSITNQWVHQTWQDPCGHTLLDAWSEINGPHGTDANLNAQYVIPFLGLDRVGPVDPISPCGVVSAYSQIEAETYGVQTGGIQIAACSEGGQDITNLQFGSSVAYSNVDFGTGAASFQARVASGSSGGNIELYLDSLTGVQVGTCTVPNTGQAWLTQSCRVGGAAGVHNLYLKFTGGVSNACALNWLRFNPAAGVDIGSVQVAGGASSSNGTFTVAGAGTDIQGAADAFHFAYVAASGDYTITARVASVQNLNAWSKAGVMIRESLDPGAANAFIAVTPSSGVTWQDRTNTAGGTTYNNTTGLSAPYWVKLVRSGNTFTASRSPDGAAWTQQGTATFTMASTAYIGLAVTSHTSSSLCTATFDNVSAPGWLAAIPPAPVGLAATAASSTQINLAWSNCANATGYNVKRSTNSGGPYATIATGITATNYADAGVSVRGGYYYVVSAMVAGSETPNSAEAAVRKLTGAIIGTAGSWSSGNTISNVFDNNLSTFFDGPTGNGCWAGLDFGPGVSNVITKINYCPRSTYESRMVGGILQGANRADFSDAVALYTVGTQPTSGTFTTVSITNTAAFRYVRYLSPNGGYGNVAELEFYGYLLSLPVVVPVPVGLSATALSSSQINLTWNALTNATGYNVKRSTTNAGPYAVIATGLTATNYPDSGLVGGTIYYYVVSAVVGGNETPNSVQATAATLSPTLGSLIHRYSFTETGGTTVADSVGGPVWTGTLPNGGTFSAGQLTLSSNSSQYVLLPAGIMSTLSNFTIEVWARVSTTANGNRLFDFGNSTASYMFLTPQSGSTGKLRFGIDTPGNAEQDINGTNALSAGMWNHLVVTLVGNMSILYLNGAAVGTNSYVTNYPSGMGSTTNNWLGRSEFSSTYLDGVLDEFRIYNAALAPAEITAAWAMGPDRVLSSKSPSVNLAATDANLTLTWPVESAGFTLQWRTNLVLGDWLNVTVPAPQIIGGQWQLLLPPPGSTNSAFFRLSK